MITQLFGNWVCWAILLVALFCYHHICLHYLRRRSTGAEAGHTHLDIHTLIGVMPLLGLLGTIGGLLTCFADLAQAGGESSALSQGISDALLTTQLGLVCAIPAWLLHAALRPKQVQSPLIDVR